MIIRLVKMEFIPGKENEFLEVFNQSKEKIRAFEGCNYLELLQDKDKATVFFTHSHWDSQEHLDNYRNSTLFAETWAKTKILFSQKAQAWSTNSLYKLS
jgi:heme oxygenase (mycobilin-producing)